MANKENAPVPTTGAHTKPTARRFSMRIQNTIDDAAKPADQAEIDNLDALASRSGSRWHDSQVYTAAAQLP